MLKRLISYTILLGCLLVPKAEARLRAFGNCEQGNHTVTTAGIISTTKVQQSYPSCIVTVYLTGTLTPATLYSDNSSTPLANPFTASSTGYWFFYADNNRYDVRLSGGGIPTPFTLGDISLADPISGTAVSSFNGRTGNVLPAQDDYTFRQINNIPFEVSSDYDFAPQTPGGSLTGGISASITITPCPLGVAGTNTVANNRPQYLRISGGTGTAEATPITGGTCTSGGATGTIIVTPANTHTGSWTISSSTAGIQEAIYATISGTDIRIPTGFINIYGQIFAPCCGYTLVGADRYGTTLQRQFTGSATMLRLSSSNIDNVGFVMGTGLTSTGSFISVDGSNQVIRRLRFTDSDISQCSATLITVSGAYSLIVDTIAIFTSSANGILWTGGSSGYVNNITSTSAATNQTVFNFESGIINANLWSLQGTGTNSTGLRIAPTGARNAGESIFTNITLDSFQYGIFATSGPGTIYSNTFSEIRCAVIGYCGIFTGPAMADIILSDWSIGVTSLSTVQQLRIDSGDGFSLNNVNITNGTGASGWAGILVGGNGGTVTGFSLKNSRIGMLENATPDSGCTNAVFIAGTTSRRIHVADNQLGCSTPLFSSSTGVNQWYSDNQGVDDTPPSISSASTVALPLANNFTLTGGVGVGTITSIKSAGSQWAFTVSASTTFTAGTTIGNTITITKVGWILWDGTKAWISGN